MQHCNHILKKICYGNLLSAHNVIKMFELNYRVKATNVSPEQHFLKKIIKMRKNLSEDIMPQLTERLEIIKKHGFKTFEVIESPDVLELEPQELERRLNLLQKFYKDKTVFLSMVKHAKSPDLNMVSIMIIDNIRQKSEVNGISGMENLRRALRCSDEKMLDIITRNPRLRSARKNCEVADKVEVLLSHGARLEDIWANSNILKNKSLDAVKSRAQTLTNIGYSNPLPVGHIGRTEEEFNSIVSKWKSDDHQRDDLKSFLESIEAVRRKPTTIYVQKEKLHYLLDRGYSLDEIKAMQVIFRNSLDSIKNALEKLNGQYLEKVPLNRCERLLSGYINAPKFQRISRNTFSCLKGHMTPKIKTKLFSHAKQCNPESLGELMKRNLAFLVEKGFSKEEVGQLPIVLCHEEGLLRSWWDVLWSEDEAFRQEVAGDRTKALNRLQYRIEKPNRFSHSCEGTVASESEEVIWQPEEVVEELEEQSDEEEVLREANLRC